MCYFFSPFIQLVTFCMSNFKFRNYVNFCLLFSSLPDYLELVEVEDLTVRAQLSLTQWLAWLAFESLPTDSLPSEVSGGGGLVIYWRTGVKVKQLVSFPLNEK